MKEVQRSTKIKSLYLSILKQIKRGDNPSKIARDLNLKKQRVSYYISTLKREGCIKKIGYGVWEYVKPFKKRSTNKTAVIGRNGGGTLKPNSVRGHGFLFKLDIQKNFRNWDKRENILKILKIKYDPYYVGGVVRGQRLTAQNVKVALTDRSILINFKESYIAETSKLARKDAVAKFLRVVKHLERILRADFSNFGKYRFKVSRQHYSLIKNSLARQYLDDGYNKKKLYVYSGRGLWLLIDNSYNLEELETVHKDTSVKDNEKVQNFFNGLDMVEGYTPQFILKVLAENNAQLLEYREQNKQHLALIQDYRKESVTNRKESVANRKVIYKMLKNLEGGKKR